MLHTLVAGGAVSREPYFPTSVNPKWRQTLLHIDLPVTWSNAATPEQIKGIEKYLTSHVNALGQIARFSDGTEASYPSESDFNDVRSLLSPSNFDLTSRSLHRTTGNQLGMETVTREY